jgi:hypothetical protein
MATRALTSFVRDSLAEHAVAVNQILEHMKDSPLYPLIAAATASAQPPAGLQPARVMFISASGLVSAALETLTKHAFLKSHRQHRA